MAARELPSCEQDGTEGAVSGGDLRGEADGAGELAVGGGQVVAKEGVVSSPKGFAGLLRRAGVEGGWWFLLGTERIREGEKC